MDSSPTTAREAVAVKYSVTSRSSASSGSNSNRVEQTGGDPPKKTAALVLRLTSDAGGRVNGEFCWVEDPLQAPVSGWDPPSDARPWMKE
jgi:hypothetical protein